MSEVQIPAAEAAGLSQLERLTDTFTAPSKTFADIKRGNRSWWLPFAVIALVSYLFFGVVAQRVGIQQVSDNQMRMNSRAQERMASLTPEQRAKAQALSAKIIEWSFVGGPALGLLATAIISLGLMGTINFGFGGRARYSEIFAVVNYAWLPSIVKSLLGAIVLFAGMAPEAFNIRNFAPTNVGAFLDPVETNKALYSLASSVDLVTIWMVVLLGMGIATVAGVKRSFGYMAVFGWWALIVLMSAGWAAAFG